VYYVNILNYWGRLREVVPLFRFTPQKKVESTQSRWAGAMQDHTFLKYRFSIYHVSLWSLVQALGPGPTSPLGFSMPPPLEKERVAAPRCSSYFYNLLLKRLVYMSFYIQRFKKFAGSN